jgi:hypothetical protein
MHWIGGDTSSRQGHEGVSLVRKEQEPVISNFLSLFSFLLGSVTDNCFLLPGIIRCVRNWTGLNCTGEGDGGSGSRDLHIHLHERGSIL